MVGYAGLAQDGAPVQARAAPSLLRSLPLSAWAPASGPRGTADEQQDGPGPWGSEALRSKLGALSDYVPDLSRLQQQLPSLSDASGGLPFLKSFSPWCGLAFLLFTLLLPSPASWYLPLSLQCFCRSSVSGTYLASRDKVVSHRGPLHGMPGIAPSVVVSHASHNCASRDEVHLSLAQVGPLLPPLSHGVAIATLARTILRKGVLHVPVRLCCTASCTALACAVMRTQSPVDLEALLHEEEATTLRHAVSVPQGIGNI